MTGVYSFRPGPSYRGATRQELFDAAMAEPLSATSTFFDQARGGILESFGLGTVLRDNLLPSEAPTEPGLVLRTEDGQRVDLPDTPAMRRRRTAFGDLAGDIQPETPQELEARRDEAGALTEDQYKASPSFRANIPWDAGMTQARAAALAAMDDAKRVREFYAEKRPVSAFLGNLTGQALDPINYVPVAGPLVKAAAVARFGRIGGAALHSALDAAGNTALFGIVTAEQRAKFGDDVSWQATISQIATAALIGGAFGTVAGAIGKRVDARAVREADQRLATLKTTQEARIALNEGIDALVRGEDVNLSPNATEPMARVAGEVATVRQSPNASIEPPVPAGHVRVYHSGSVGEGETGRWVSTNREYASNYRADLPLFYLDIPNTDPRVNNADIPEQGVRQGFTFNFETLPEEAAQLKEISRSLTEEGVFGKRRGAIPSMARLGEVQGGSIVGFDEINGHVRLIDGSEVPVTNGGGTIFGPKGIMIDPLAVSEFKNASGSQWVPVRQPSKAAAIDTSQARPEPLPEGRTQAETRIAKSDDGKALADQYRVDPQTGAFAEEGEIAQLEAEGRLTEDDAATLAAAQADFETGAAYAEALKSVAGCLI